MNFRLLKILFCLSTMLLSFSCLQAAVTFVNATYDNTEAVDGTVPWYGGRTPPIWRDRNADYGIFTADEDTYLPNNDYIMIKTTITESDGLVAGYAYNVYLYFNGYNEWSVMGGLGEISIEGFSDINRTIGANYHIGADDPSNRVEWVGGGYQDQIYRALLGVATANSNGEIFVYIDDPDNAGMTDHHRCWYDGVGYEIITSASPIAWDPDPIINQDDVDFNATFSWNAGWSNGTINPDIEFHRFFLSAPNDPNLPENDYIDIPAGTPVNMTAEYDLPGDLEASSQYFWRVDEVLSSGSVLTGSVWNFSTRAPVCQDSPETDITGPGGVQDCIVDIHDLLWFIEQWLDSQ